MTPKGTTYAAGKNGRIYVAYEDMTEGKSGSFIQVRPTDKPGEWKEYGPMCRQLNLSKAVLLVGKRLAEVGQYTRLWVEV